MQIAFQGEIGAYSEEAVRALFPAADVVPKASFGDVFEAVEAGNVAYGVVPIENSLFGSVHINYDLLRDHDLVIVGELKLRIRHNLMALPGVTLADIQRVYSHPQGLGQCQTFLKTQLGHAEAIATYDTAGSAKMVAEEQSRDVAAIASQQAAKEYGLNILAAGIESNHQNYTRFLILAPDATPLPHLDAAPSKTSVAYAMRTNVPGALFKSLAVFALRDIDLYKIESRPLVGSPGEYLFYLDLAGSIEDTPVQRALDHLQEIAAYLKVLGSYPQGRTVE